MKFFGKNKDVKITPGSAAQDRADFKRLMRLVRPHVKRLLLSVVFMGLTAAATAGTAYIIKPLLDKVFISRDPYLLNVIPFVALGIYVSKGLFSFFQSYLMSYVGNRIVNDLRVALYSHMQRLSLSFFHRNSTGALMSRVVNDVGLIQGSVTAVVTSMVLDVFTVVGLVFVLFKQNWKLAFIGLFILPAAMYPIISFGRRLRRLATAGQEIMGGLLSILTETFQGARMIQAYNMTDYEIARFSDECRRSLDNLMRAVTIRSLSSPLMESLGGVCVAGIIWYGGYAVIRGESTPGAFISFMAALLLLYDPLKRLARMNNEVQQGLSAARRIFDVLDLRSDVQSPPDPKPMGEVRGEIEFRGLHFSYVPEREALKGIDLTVRPGEMLAIVGPSGGGKTSLVNLVPRFYDPTSGRILIDGLDLRDVSLTELRGNLSLVSQEIVLFNASARHNIAYGRMGAAEEEIHQAARAALADDFIRAMPHGYDEIIGEGGSRLSGGQRQRLSIARAILKNAPILILDEATSALDTESEKYVQAALDNLMKNRTTLVIAHRLSTIRQADRIIVLKEGRLVEEGSHDRLMALQGEYYKLYQMQFASEQTAEAPAE